MEQAKLVLSNVTIISRESPIRNTLMKKQQRGAKKTRLCAGNMTLLKQHLNSMKRVHLATCQMCGKETYMECHICKKHVCFTSGKHMTSLSCCIDFHDDLMYGLGFLDRVELFGVQKSQFTKADAAEVRKNKTNMKKWKTKYMRNTLEIWTKEDKE